MKKQAVIFVKIFIYSALIITLSCLLYFDEKRVETLKLQYRLKWGRPTQKEDVLNLFMEKHPRALVPAVIQAILDDTALPRHGDTGWGTVYHQAATAMCHFARLIDGKSKWERGIHEYSFHSDVGRASLERRIEIHRKWKKWWNNNKSSAINYHSNGRDKRRR